MWCFWLFLSAERKQMLWFSLKLPRWCDLKDYNRVYACIEKKRKNCHDRTMSVNDYYIFYQCCLLLISEIPDKSSVEVYFLRRMHACTSILQYGWHTCGFIAMFHLLETHAINTINIIIKALIALMGRLSLLRKWSFLFHLTFKNVSFNI